MNIEVRKGFILFWIFFKGMLFAFTNGMAALPTIERSIVDKRKWLTDKEFWTYPVLSQSLPGVVSIHNSILLGNRIAGPFGAFMSALGVILPAFLTMLLVAAVFQKFVDDPFVHGAIRGIRIISVVIIFSNALRLLRNVPRQTFPIILVFIALLVPLLSGFSAFWTIIVCGIAGIISVLIDPSVIQSKPAASEKSEE